MSSENNPIRNFFMKALDYYMAKDDITQRQLADMIGVKPPTINNLFTGKRNPGLKLQTKIAEAFGYNLEQFLDGGKLLIEGHPDTYSQIDEEVWKNKYYAKLEEHEATLKQMTVLHAELAEIRNRYAEKEKAQASTPVKKEVKKAITTKTSGVRHARGEELKTP